MTGAGATVVGGTPLFRLYDVSDALAWQDRLARRRIWTRAFPWSADWLRLGLLVLRGGTWDGTPVVPGAWVDVMRASSLSWMGDRTPPA